ncbi:hypothetical protein [Phycicoccus sonneratiae]|uniref:Sigma-70 family RNA polymerase sigma factor n=1 Tax=Phycicoccus sonneratiae TaxID=2807628 RepID=A0ABS2CRU0_9MICO|nr:hypothetical protein [Phycicoccus sonneraticus]MBM6402607.1 hypothetical protein [Phycicoccus sonneraticus]
MSVAAMLGLDDPDSELLAQAQTRWSGWCVDHPGLDCAPSLPSLRQWLLACAPDQADGALAALANLGNCRGGGDPAAAAVLCWTLLPGASTLARGLATLCPDIDQVVASQLWIEVRSGRIPARHVAANVLRNVRKGVLRHLGVGQPVGSRCDTAMLVDPTSRLWLDLPNPDRHPTAKAELEDLLERACRDGVIDLDDCRLLVRLARASGTGAGPRRAGRGGLTASAATTVVSAELGISGRTVRRRVQRSLTALAAAYAVETVPA